MLPDLPDARSLELAAEIVYRTVKPTPQYRWPLLEEALGTEIWVKHENHGPVGAFKVRGGLVYFQELRARDPGCRGVVSATRGNHGQSLGVAARLHGLHATVFVPHGNSREKNAAMRALGVTLIEHGDDYQASHEEAARYAQREGLHMIPSFHEDLVRGVATYWTEFFRNVADLDVVYVPIGLGSGIVAGLAARAACGARTKIVGVTSSLAPTYALSHASRTAVPAPTTTRLADGMACRVPNAMSLEIVLRHVEEIVQVTDEEVGAAMRLLFVSTHNVAEGAGAAALAAALQQRAQLGGRKVGVIVTGGNVDADIFADVLRFS